MKLFVKIYQKLVVGNGSNFCELKIDASRLNFFKCHDNDKDFKIDVNKCI